MNKKKFKSNKWVVIVFIVLLLFCCVSGCALIKKASDNNKTIDYSLTTPDFKNLAEDTSATEIESSSGIETGSSGCVELLYKTQAVIDTTNKTVSIDFGIGTDATHDVFLQLGINDSNGNAYKIAESSGKLTAGKRTNSLVLYEPILDILPKGQYEGFLRVYYYSETNVSGNTTTNLPCIIYLN